MKKSYLISSIVLLIFLNTITSVFSQPSTNEPRRILVLGDSISAGYGVISGKNWPNLLQDKLQAQNNSYQVINASISGETTFGGLSRIKNLLDKNHPQIVILELGANDCLRGFRIEDIENNLQKIISLNQQYGAKTLLIGMKVPNNYGPQYTLEIEKMYQRLAKKNRLAFIPFLLEKFALKREFFQDDGIHPTTKAQPMMLENCRGKITPLVEVI
jgi:acyl-CoA thioesterase-1